MKVLSRRHKIWKRITLAKLMVFAATFAGLYLLFISSLWTYYGMPVSNAEVRYLEGIVGFCFLMIAILIYSFRRRKI